MAEPRLILIDGYNLVHRSEELKPGPNRTLRESRDKLINLLSWVLGTGEAHFLVVFDGAEVASTSAKEEGGSGRVEVRYSRPPDKADDLIRRLVEEKIDRVERLTVVTSDIEVARHARAMGADVSLSDLFLASVLGPTRESGEEKPTTLTKKEIEEWSQLFIRREKGAASTDDEASS